MAILPNIVPTLLTAAQGTLTSALGLGTPGQTFQTQPVVNQRTALYALTIVGPSPSTQVYASYTFPLSPTSVSRETTAMSNVYDVAGTQQQGGVSRQLDSYGLAPVNFTIEGTTGWQLHATDGYAYDGISSILALQQLLNLYAQLNTGQAINNQPLYTLEFYDYFLNDYWQVEPVGRQEPIRQNAARPIIAEYSFRFAGIVDLGQPGTAAIQAASSDPIAAQLSTSATQAQSSLSSSLGSSLDAYAPNTPGAQSDATFDNLP